MMWKYEVLGDLKFLFIANKIYETHSYENPIDYFYAALSYTDPVKKQFSAQKINVTSADYVFCYFSSEIVLYFTNFR